jgi:hypothetical protein
VTRGSFLGSAALALVPPVVPRDALATRAESSGYAEASTPADVRRVLAELDARGAPVSLGSAGTTVEGRDIPFVVASRPRVRTASDARALRRPVVLVVAASDAANVAGTEASLAMVRDLCLSPQKTMLEELVLVVVPLLNVDGAERPGSVRTNAPHQNGPERVGTRANANDVVIETDFVRVDAPETRALLQLVRYWQPDVVVVLTSNDGGYYRFAATSAPPLHPAAVSSGPFVRDRLLPAVRAELRRTFGMETFSSGGFGFTQALPAPPPSPEDENYGWFPGDYRARIPANYLGLRGVLALSVSAYGHDPFERRIFTTRAFVETVLGFCCDHDAGVMSASRAMRRWHGGSVPLGAALPATPAAVESIDYENLVLAGAGEREAGVPEGFARTGTYGSATLPVYDRYAGAEYRVQPKIFLIPAEHASGIEPLLQTHAIAYDVASRSEAYLVRDYLVEALDRARPVNGCATLALSGRWSAERPYATAPGDLLVRGAQAAGPLVSLFLEPESEDGFIAWEAFDRAVAVGAAAPVLRAELTS